MKIQQVAVQIYTLRNHLTTQSDIVATLKRVRAIGYQAVELISLSSVTDVELKRIVADEGLLCCSAHDSSDNIRQNPGAVADRLDALGCQHVVCSYPSNVDLGSEASVNSFIEDLDSAGKVLADRGKTLCYHNHGMEFRHLNGRSILELIYEKITPRHLQAELDTYWVQYGGGDPVDWCSRLKGRLPLLHIKDYGFSPGNTPCFAEIGNGNLRWPEILAAAEAAGCGWFIVEQDTCPGDPFDSLTQSFDYIQAKLVQ